MPVRPQVARRPLVSGGLAFAAGLAVGGPEGAGLGHSLLVLFAATLTVWRGTRGSPTAVLLLPAVFLFMGAWVSTHAERPRETLSEVWEGEVPAHRLVLEGWVEPGLEVRPGGVRQRIQLTGAARGPVPGRLHRVSGPVELTVAGAHSRCGRIGDRIRVHARVRAPASARFPGGFSGAALARRRGYALTAWAAHPSACAVAQVGGWRWSRGVAELRSLFREGTSRLAPEQTRGVILALALGDRSQLKREDQAAFRAAGLSHLLAVSGFHLGVVAWLFLSGAGALFRRWPAMSRSVGAHRASAALTLPVLGLYVLLVGAPPSAVRAGLMFGAVLVGRVLHRGSDPWSTLSGALVVMLALNPPSLWDPGLQLSFAAVASLLYLPRAFETAVDRLGARTWSVPVRWVGSALVASTAATVGTAPLIAIHFGRLSVVGVLVNVPAGLIASLTVPLAVGGATLAPFTETLAVGLLGAAGWGAEGLLALAHGASSVPWGQRTVFVPTPLEVSLFLVSLIFLSSSRTRGRGAWALLLLGSLVAFGEGARITRRDTRVTFLPVGQGDAAVIELPGGDTVVVDLGPRGRRSDAGERMLAPFLRARRRPRVDLLVLTHPHADHIGGWEGLTERFEVGEVWWTGDAREGPADLVEAIAAHGAKRVLPGMEWVAGEARVTVLGPERATDFGEVNDGSVVLMVEHGLRRILMTGDAEVAAEAKLTSRLGRSGLSADVLKVGHHGSRTSSSMDFLAVVQPQHAVISCGEGNSFGFPHREALRRLEGAGARVWRTDVQGAITVRTDGEALSVEAYVSEERPR
ncbi:MAG: DNA internalization-related competence protein ComEC/Rec2 [Myxococcota bacterium]